MMGFPAARGPPDPENRGFSFLIWPPLLVPPPCEGIRGGPRGSARFPYPNPRDEELKIWLELWEDWLARSPTAPDPPGLPGPGREISRPGPRYPGPGRDIPADRDIPNQPGSPVRPSLSAGRKYYQIRIIRQPQSLEVRYIEGEPRSWYAQAVAALKRGAP